MNDSLTSIEPLTECKNIISTEYIASIKAPELFEMKYLLIIDKNKKLISKNSLYIKKSIFLNELKFDNNTLNF